MNETLLETANLYALGLLTEAERTAFEQELRFHPALQQEVHALQEAALLLARSAPQVAPPADLRGELLAAFTAGTSAPAVATAREPIQKPMVVPASVSAVPPRAGSPLKILHFIPWAAAAALAFFFHQNQLATDDARLQSATAQAETAAAKSREEHYVEAVSASAAAQAQSDANLAQARAALTKAEAALAALSTERETLTAELAVLRKDSKLDKTRIAVLGSLLKNQPQAVAVSLWRQESQEGLLVVENMPALAPGRDYQLWVIDPNQKTPVSAGVFKVDAEGKVRLEFKPAHNVQSAYKFAVTIEKEGGAMVPNLEQMVVIGG